MGRKTVGLKLNFDESRARFWVDRILHDLDHCEPHQRRGLLVGNLVGIAGEIVVDVGVAEADARDAALVALRESFTEAVGK